eukprot:CAMPEP_0197916416 /NCGR_PEP_ID=MMETSP1439-20131203/81950_1 /TAXON_ID=66791 /ORGANISM="Gonyaulax spinifera, Strain CCMP409" /LENGTH=264 /DNA_ID=CAMNT_0043538437 /DNA_START=22 /DNA_END=814 /DNA_ORIENTATION=-
MTCLAGEVGGAQLGAEVGVHVLLLGGEPDGEVPARHEVVERLRQLVDTQDVRAPLLILAPDEVSLRYHVAVMQKPPPVQERPEGVHQERVQPLRGAAWSQRDHPVRVLRDVRLQGELPHVLGDRPLVGVARHAEDVRRLVQGAVRRRQVVRGHVKPRARVPVWHGHLLRPLVDVPAPLEPAGQAGVLDCLPRTLRDVQEEGGAPHGSCLELEVHSQGCCLQSRPDHQSAGPMETEDYGGDRPCEVHSTGVAVAIIIEPWGPPAR